MSDVVAQSLKRVFLPVAALLAAMIGLGLLVTKVAERSWPCTVEDGINPGLAGHRTGWANGVSWFLSALAGTPGDRQGHRS
jgi:undecaprenyl-diphosphatase